MGKFVKCPLQQHTIVCLCKLCRVVLETNWENCDRKLGEGACNLTQTKFSLPEIKFELAVKGKNVYIRDSICAAM
jgi:hypothetical protein